ncbi:DUF4291 domain-containing protein [Pectobacterium wasabiae]|uniref:DUF4291 domain-containing protein n=1 Tax=Pectobacterium wasabiae TaxID=55208 RepID=A0AAW3EJC0_9GAMM|nr:DUF4291 domain-containing protein [Pectobacterium wasabiae]AOR64572.1 hypothetical protein A7983_15200 [Pectobacterium wasabiae CFBP 3304]EJS93329.1 Hypothetical protein Y17_3352 [Pectobacterium wasabiae CFBP 3304]KFX08935.1 hypothetical protein JV38_04360 [Pectobacterium wasabiae]KGA29042.1 hypothetical protein KU73_08085 [Pectobacterium wasabiae]
MDSSETIPQKQLRAYYTSSFIRVYQAYSDEIADSTLANGKFISPPFSLSRMTWIKPSFLWMMYRSGWAKKDPGQNRILAIDLTHSGFREIINQGVLSHRADDSCLSNDEWKKKVTDSNVVIQWDPERDLLLNKLDYRTIQIGLRGEAVKRYTEEWIVDIHDITEHVTEIHNLVISNRLNAAYDKLPHEEIYHI